LPARGARRRRIPVEDNAQRNISAVRRHCDIGTEAGHSPQISTPGTGCQDVELAAALPDDVLPLPLLVSEDEVLFSADDFVPELSLLDELLSPPSPDEDEAVLDEVRTEERLSFL
jgi:hypothetical protein